MGKIFLDANVFIDLVEKRNTFDTNLLHNQKAYVAVSSIGIWFYISKHKIKQVYTESILNQLNLVAQTIKITKQSFIGPTNDFEDNVQIHTALSKKCRIFLTNDKKLLKLKTIGKMHITASFNIKKGTSPQDKSL